MKKELAEKIISSNYEYIGIRHLTEDEDYKVGDYCRSSYDWDYENDRSSYETDDPEELPGTCAYNTRIDPAWDDEEEVIGKIKNAISESSCYSGKIAIIAGNYAEYGNDPEEIIIRDAEVIFLAA